MGGKPMSILSDPAILTILSSTATSLGGAYIGFKTAKMQQKSKDSADNRQGFTEDMNTIRAVLMEEFKRSREQMDRLQTQNDELVVQNIDLRKKVILLQEQNDRLLADVTKLREQNKIHLIQEDDVPESSG